MRTKKVIFLGSIKKVTLHPEMGREWERIPEFKEPHLVRRIKLIETKEFFSCELAPPDLKPDEKFFITEMGLVITIIDKMRNSNDNIVYVTNHVIETIEPTDEERKEANEHLNTLIKIRKEKEEESKRKIEKEKSFWSKLFG